MSGTGFSEADNSGSKVDELFNRTRETKSEIDPHYLFVMVFSLALFSSGFQIGEIIRRLGIQSDFAPYNKYFKNIGNLVSGYGFKISSAIGNTLRVVKITPFKEFLIRFSQSISYGDDPVEFLERELSTSSAIFQATNERKQESMNTFLSLYGTMNSALVFLMVDMAVMGVLYDIGTSVISLITIGLAMISAMMTFVIYVLYKPFTRMIFPVHGSLLSMIAIMGTGGVILLFHNFTVIFASGLGLVCLGIYFRVMEHTEKTLERDYLVFVRYFSRTFEAVGTLGQSLLGVLRGELGSMRPIVKKMHIRSQFGIDKRRLFKIMSEESKSQMIMMGNSVIGSTLEAGGDVGYVGGRLANLMEMILNIGIRREQNGRAFETTVYTMQLTTAAVGGALISVLGVFTNLFSKMATTIFPVGQVNIAGMENLVLLLLVVLSYSGGFAITIAHGKPQAMSPMSIGILLMITIVVFTVSTVLAQNIFGSLFAAQG